MKEFDIRDDCKSSEELFEEFIYKDPNAESYFRDLGCLWLLCPQRSVLEFGTWQGGGIAAFMRAGFDEIYSVDVDISRVNKDLFYRLAADEDIELEIIQGSSLDDNDLRADLVFLDTKHTYDHVKRELEVNSEKANRLIAIHDTNYPPSRLNPDKLVRDAVLDFITDNKDDWHLLFENASHTGLMVIERVQFTI